MSARAKILLIFIALSGFSAVLMGAAAAHWLQAVLRVEDISRINTAATYQIYHSLALLGLLALSQLQYSWRFGVTALFWVSGILLFSGSLYAYSFTHLMVLVYITPVGGLCFMLGWLSLLLPALR